MATSSSEMQRKSIAARGDEKDMRCEEMRSKAKERQVDIRMGKNICPLEYNEKCKEDFIWDFQAPMKNSGQQ